MVPPAMILQPRRRAGGVSHVAAHPVGVVQDPIQRPPRRPFELPDEHLVATPAPDLAQEDEKQRGRVHGPVVGCLRDLTEIGEFPVPELVQYLARLCVAEVASPRAPGAGPAPSERSWPALAPAPSPDTRR